MSVESDWKEGPIESSDRTINFSRKATRQNKEDVAQNANREWSIEGHRSFAKPTRREKQYDQLGGPRSFVSGRPTFPNSESSLHPDDFRDLPGQSGTSTFKLTLQKDRSVHLSSARGIGPKERRKYHLDLHENTMGSGASKEVEVDEADGGDNSRQVQSQAAMSDAPGLRSQASFSGRPVRSHISQQGRMSAIAESTRSRDSRVEGYDVNIVQITKDGFSTTDVTVMEGQVVTFVWDETCSPVMSLLQVRSKINIGEYRKNCSNHDSCFV
ncbi:hypothetical protein PoB_001085000 [Plakobranchus ocellatus]|uniref:Uncharacterized protein n=1 Tax=Plakobranchus ocellatus TaxID=259542 RepID=A0AAV3YNP3_9GAST|nr:hypothetical protein PoB_001085000 [Plakobranchus ocellatus]